MKTKVNSNFNITEVSNSNIKINKPSVVKSRKESKEVIKEKLKTFHKQFIENKKIYEVSIKQEKLFFNYYSWNNINLMCLCSEFESKFYFNFNYFVKFFCNYSQKGIKIIPYYIYLKTFPSIKKLVKKIIYNPKDNTFNSVPDDKHEIISLFLSFNEKYKKCQLNAISHYDILDKNRKYLKRYFKSFFYEIIKSTSIENNVFCMKEVLLYCLRDFFSLKEYCTLKFLFPEFKIIFNFLGDINNLYFLKRLHMYAGCFYLRFCFFKKIIKEEIEAEICKNGKFDIFECKYFSYFIISSKMLLQPLLFRFDSFKKLEIKKIVCSYYLFYLQIYSKKIRDLIQVNPFFIFHKRDISNDFYDNFDYEIIHINKNCTNLCSTPLELKCIPSFQNIKEVFDDKNSFRILILLIDKGYNLSNICENADELENIFYEKLKTLLLKDFY